MVREQVTQLASTPGVMGCCLVARDGAILVDAMPSSLAPDLRAAADAAVEALLAVETIEEGAWELDVAYGEAICVIRPVATTVLLMLCEPEANLPVIKLGLNVAAKRIASAPSQELEELRAAAHSPSAAHGEDLLPPEAVRSLIGAIKGHVVSKGGSEASVDQILAATGLDLDFPTRPALRTALNELLERTLVRTMGRAEATRWLNQLVRQYGLAKQSP